MSDVAFWSSRRVVSADPLLPLSPVSPRERQFVEEEYLRRYFRPALTSTKLEALLSSSRPSLALENSVFESPVPTRSRFGKRS
jgi:hypothetical protein